MQEENILISMTKEEMLKFYTNKMIEDGIRECSEFNTSIYLTEYDNGIDLSKYKDEILEILYKDERIADVMINEELCVDMVFYTSYCPYFYDEVDIGSKEESEILSDFYYYCSSRVYENGYVSIRALINGFVEEKLDQKDYAYNILKKDIVETGFIDKYIENNNETYITLKNKKEFETLLEIKINELSKQFETKEQEEFE